LKSRNDRNQSASGWKSNMQFEKINENKMIINSALTNHSQNINKSKEQHLNELYKELQLK